MRGAAFLLIVVVGLTAGITAAALDVVAAYLWRPLPYPEADRLMVADFPRAGGLGPRELQQIDWTGVADLAALTAAWDVDAFAVSGDITPFAASGRWITADVFTLVGATPAAGRFFTAEEARRGEPLALIGYELWQSRYGGSASAIARTITVRATLRQNDSETFTIVGVLPRRFWHLGEQLDLVLPLKDQRPPGLLRLRAGVTPRQAADRLTALVRTQVPSVSAEWAATVRPAHEAHVDRIRPMLTATSWGVGLLAVVALANLTFLQTTRGLARQREMAVRAALGARGADIARQLLNEGLVTGAGAGVLALATASVLLRGGLTAVEHYFGRAVPGGAASLGSDPIILGGVVAASVGTGVLLALVLLLASKASTIQRSLAGHPAGTDGPGRLAARQLIVAAQVAAAFALLVAAALMIRTAWHLGRVELGFEARGVLSANVTVHESTYRTLEQRRKFFARVIERLDALPEITHAGLTDWLPFRVGPVFSIEPEGEARLTSIGASIQAVNPTYFNALEMRLLEGRYLSPDDRSDRARVAVISRALARSLWDDQPAVGRAFRLRFSNAPGRGFGPYRIVGVVDNSLRSLVDATPPQVYLAFDQGPRVTNAFLQLKTTMTPLDLAPTVARIVSEADRDVPLASVAALDTIVAGDGVRPRFLAQVLAAFALVAVALALIGLYAVSAWIAERRQREAALRVALGADRESVALLLVRRGFIAVAGGLVVGWTIAGALTATMAAELHGVSASDLSTRILVAGVLAATSAIALWRPAWRAATMNLSALLRSE